MAEQKNNVVEIDYLDEDKPIPGQNWVCVSFFNPMIKPETGKSKKDD